MTNEEIWRIALEQSAYDSGCEPEDFLKTENVVNISKGHPLARKYLKFPLSCDLVSYGNNIVAQASPEIAPLVKQYIDRYPAAHCFETPKLHVLDEMLRPFGQKICFMAEYFLPDINALRALPCGYELRLLHQEDFRDLYLPQWSNALCEERKQLDVLGVGAYDNGKLIALAGCSADCEEMYQIGVDVLPEYRRKGIASAITSRLALEILALGKVPFYCAAWCNIKSVRNAIRCGFRPAWVAMTAKDAEFVDRMNRGEEMNIRTANFEDMALAGRIMALSFRTAFRDFVSPQTMDACAREDNCIALLEGIFREGQVHFLMGGDSGMLAWQQGPQGAEIVAIHTLPESHGTGLGAAMLTEALRRIGPQPVHLWAFKENIRARRFYEKHGFRWDGAERTSEFDGALEVRYIKD